MTQQASDEGLFDRRRAARFPVQAECELRRGHTRVRGQCWDISESGVALAVDAWDGGRFTLHLRFHLGGLNVRCDTVRIEPMRATVIVHARFEAMDASVKQLLDAVVADAQAEFEESQRGLISDPMGVNRRKSA